MEWQIYIDEFFATAYMDLVRYFLFAGTPYLIFYVIFRTRFFKMKIQQKHPKMKDVRREVFYSISSVMVFSAISLFSLALIRNGHTQIYGDLSDYGIAYFVFSIPLLIILHDTWFYWTHRAMHWKPVFKYVHLIHHKSTDPTPWAAFSFHPLEAIVQVIYFPIILVLIPAHPAAILTMVLYQFALNVGGHLGFEVFPKGFTKSKWTFWHNTSTHHNMHYKYFDCNYSLYFNVWDRLMGTNHAKYDEAFEGSVSGERPGKR